MGLAQLFVGLLSVYALAGIIFAAAFVIVGIGRVDPVAQHAPWGFRLIILPGAAVFWPLLLRRWFLGGRR